MDIIIVGSFPSTVIIKNYVAESSHRTIRLFTKRAASIGLAEDLFDSIKCRTFFYFNFLGNTFRRRLSNLTGRRTQSTLSLKKTSWAMYVRSLLIED